MIDPEYWGEKNSFTSENFIEQNNFLARFRWQ